MSIQELEAEIMRLQPKEQAYLFGRLAQALDAEEEPLTTEELDRRVEDLRSGCVQGVPADEILSAARRLL